MHTFHGSIKDEFLKEKKSFFIQFKVLSCVFTFFLLCIIGFFYFLFKNNIFNIIRLL